VFGHMIRCGDAANLIKAVEKESIDLLVTSPPYWAKRIYNEEGEFGTERTPEEYVERMADFFKGLEPYLKREGNIFINIGDTYFGGGSGFGGNATWHSGDGKVRKDVKKLKEKYIPDRPLQGKIERDGKLYQDKQLLLIPARFAIAMQDRGWILRDDIIWHKPNKIPSGVQDRFWDTYEHVYHFVLQGDYYFDLDAVKITGKYVEKKNPGNMWSINTRGNIGTEHTASYPEELIDPIVLCGSPKGGYVLDPFLGTGTTWVVCERFGRNCVGFEINESFLNYARRRFYGHLIP